MFRLSMSVFYIISNKFVYSTIIVPCVLYIIFWMYIAAVLYNMGILLAVYISRIRLRASSIIFVLQIIFYCVVVFFSFRTRPIYLFEKKVACYLFSQVSPFLPSSYLRIVRFRNIVYQFPSWHQVAVGCSHLLLHPLGCMLIWSRWCFQLLFHCMPPWRPLHQSLVIFIYWMRVSWCNLTVSQLMLIFSFWCACW